PREGLLASNTWLVALESCQCKPLSTGKMPVPPKAAPMIEQQPAVIQEVYRDRSGLTPSGVSSLSISNHSFLNSIRRLSPMARLVVSAITASPSATLGWQ